MVFLNIAEESLMSNMQPLPLKLTNSYWADEDSEDSPFPPPERLSAASLATLFLDSAEECQHKCFASWRDRSDGQWTNVSWREARESAIKLLSFFNSHLHLKPGEQVLLLSCARYEAILCDLALSMCGSVLVPLPPETSDTLLCQALEETRPSIICLENEMQLEKLLSTSNGKDNLRAFANLKGLIIFDHCPEQKNITFPANLLELPKILDQAPETTSHVIKHVKEIAKRIPKSTLSCIRYAAEPPSQMQEGSSQVCCKISQTHGNYLAMIDALLLSLLLGKGNNLFLGLPISCSFVRACAYAAFALGGSLIFPSLPDGEAHSQGNKTELLKLMLRDFKDSHPEIILTDMASIENICSVALKRESKLLRWSLREKSSANSATKTSPQSILSTLRLELAKAVTAKVRKSLFGSRIKYLLSGGPPVIERAMQDFLEALDAPVYQGLWLDAASGAVSCNTPKWHNKNSLGRPFVDLDISTEEKDCCLLVRGRAVSETSLREDSSEWLNTDLPVSINGEGFIIPSSI